MKICIISSIFHGFGKIGGYGAMARQLSDALVERGHSVIVIVPRRKGQAVVTHLNGYDVLGVSMIDMINPWLYKKVDADIYHSQSPNLMSTAALLGAADKKHIITCRDPRNLYDWWVEIKDATWKRRIRNIFLSAFEEGPLVTWAIRRADRIGFAAKDVRDKVLRMYHPSDDPYYLPNIERVPDRIPRKATKPTVCFVGRLDKRKRPELFIDLAPQFPDVDFLIVGRAEDSKRHEMLIRRAAQYANITMCGYVDKFTESEQFYDVYNKSWILINTASREAFPLTYFEAGGRGCAVLSHVNPDGFLPECGFCAETDNFAEGLRFLLDNDQWRQKGECAYRYVTARSCYDDAVNVHLDLYEKVLSVKA